MEIEFSTMPTFWKSAPTRYVDVTSPSRPNARGVDGGVTVASTSDLMSEVERVADDDYERGEDDSVVFTQLDHAEPGPDGGTEHNEPKVYINGKKPNPNDARLADYSEYLTHGAIAANAPNALASCEAAKSVHEDWQEVVSNPPVKLSERTRTMIVSGLITNSGELMYYVCKRPAEIVKLNAMTDKQKTDYLIKLDVQRARNPENFGMDTASYAEYRSIRNKQIAARYK